MRARWRARADLRRRCSGFTLQQLARRTPPPGNDFQKQLSPAYSCSLALQTASARYRSVLNLLTETHFGCLMLFFIDVRFLQPNQVSKNQKKTRNQSGSSSSRFCSGKCSRRDEIWTGRSHDASRSRDPPGHFLELAGPDRCRGSSLDRRTVDSPETSRTPDWTSCKKSSSRVLTANDELKPCCRAAVTRQKVE